MERRGRQDEADPSGHDLPRRTGADGAGAVPAETLAARLCQAVAAGGPHGPADAGMALAATVLWSRFLRFDVADPSWPDRDRFVLSSGRFLPLLRALLLLTGHGAVPPGCAFGRHPAIETASGPPGQGFAAAVGMAMAERAMAGRFGRTLVDHRTWVLACETDLAAGVSLEAAFLAGRMALDKLVVLSDGAHGPDSQAEAMTRFAASGWAVRRVDRDDPEALAAAMLRAMRNRRPTLLACQPNVAGAAARRPGRRPALHGNGLPGPERDPAASDGWAACGQRGAGARRGWLRRLARHRLHDEFGRTIDGRLPPGWRQDWTQGWHQGGTQDRTRSRAQGRGADGRPQREQDHDAPRAPSASRDAGTLGTARAGLALLCGLLPEMMTLHSRAGAGLAVPLPQADGRSAPRTVRHLACGVQEHGMAALTNGLSLHGGARPVLAASVVSIDRMRPALRLAALMGQPVIYLLGDDGLQPGADGAGWQPVEQLASLRAMPEVALFRPADHAEMVACWELALRRDDGPSLIAVSPEALAPLSADAPGDAAPARERFCARGGYLRAPSDGPRSATLIATGPEVAVAIEARARLREAGISVAVVSLPCWELFATQPAAYRADVLGEAPRIGIEAASGFGWERWLGADGVFIGMDGFDIGPTGPSPRRTGITPEQVAARVRRRLGPVRSGPDRPGTGLV